MREGYTRPPLVGDEPVPGWVAVWRFRVVALVLLAALVYLVYLAFQHLSGATAQDPGVGARPAFTPPAASAPLRSPGLVGPVG